MLVYYRNFTMTNKKRGYTMILKKTYTLDIKDIKESYDIAYRGVNKDLPEIKKDSIYNKSICETILINFLKDNKIEYTINEEGIKLENNKIISVKVRTNKLHNSIMEPVTKLTDSNIDIYVLVKANADKKSGSIIGWTYKNDIISINRIYNSKKLEKYIVKDDELRPIRALYNLELS